MALFKNLITLALAFLLSSAAAQDLAPIPPLKARVADTVSMLKPNQRAALENKLKQHEDKTGNQVAILIVRNTGAEAIEQYGIRVADAWKIGRKGVDDGVILIVARDTRKLRLEVGRGAEGVIPDAYAKRIVQDVIAPRFRQNDFYGGINDGITTIHTLLNKEAFPSVKRAKAAADPDTWGDTLLRILLPFLFAIGFVYTVIRIKRRRGDDGWGKGYAADNSHRIYVGPGWYTPGDSGGGGFDGGGWGGGGGDFGGGGASGSW